MSTRAQLPRDIAYGKIRAMVEGAKIVRQELCAAPAMAKPLSDSDVIIVGAGHNGLTCAAYLGMAGLRVRVSSGVAWSAALV